MAIKLDTIRKAAETKYAHTQIELDEGRVVTLLNVLRLPEDRREALSSKEGEDDDDAKQVDRFRDMVRAVADSEENANELIAAVGDDLATYLEIFREYNEATQLGEASASHA